MYDNLLCENDMTEQDMEKMTNRELIDSIKANSKMIDEQHKIIKAQLDAILKELKVLGVDLEVNN